MAAMQGDAKTQCHVSDYDDNPIIKDSTLKLITYCIVSRSFYPRPTLVSTHCTGFSLSNNCTSSFACLVPRSLHSFNMSINCFPALVVALLNLAIHRLYSIAEISRAAIRDCLCQIACCLSLATSAV